MLLVAIIVMPAICITLFVMDLRRKRNEPIWDERRPSGKGFLAHVKWLADYIEFKKF